MKVQFVAFEVVILAEKVSSQLAKQHKEESRDEGLERKAAGAIARRWSVFKSKRGGSSVRHGRKYCHSCFTRKEGEKELL